MELLLKGGWLMIPMLFLSILTIYAIIDRIIALRKYGNISKPWLTHIYNQVLTGDIEEAKLLCVQKKTAIANVIQAGLEVLPHELNTLDKSMEFAGQIEIYKLEKNLSLLGAITGTAPMLGFLGTVMGMVQAFMSMAYSTTAVTPQLLANGIYEAMITTAAGLAIGIIADLGYKYVLTSIEQVSREIEQAINQLTDIIQEGYKIRSAKNSYEA
eukprot:gene332-424_t